MSAFFVARATIDAAVSAIIAAEGPMSTTAATKLGRQLWAMNAEAIRWRYELDTGSEDERQEHAENLADVESYAWEPRHFEIPTLAKSLACLSYQCSEGSVPKRALFKRLAKARAVHQVAGVEETAEYQTAPWGLDNFEPLQAQHFPTELTPIGEQLVIPGCERTLPSGRPVQLSLF